MKKIAIIIIFIFFSTSGWSENLILQEPVEELKEAISKNNELLKFKEKKIENDLNYMKKKSNQNQKSQYQEDNTNSVGRIKNGTFTPHEPSEVSKLKSGNVESHEYDYPVYNQSIKSTVRIKKREEQEIENTPKTIIKVNRSLDKEEKDIFGRIRNFDDINNIPVLHDHGGSIIRTRREERKARDPRSPIREIETNQKTIPKITQPKSGPWIFDFNGKSGSPLDQYYEPEILGISSLRSPRSPFKKRFIYDLSIGSDPDGSRLLSATTSVRVNDHIIGLSYERAEWLDYSTNTGKYIEGLMLDYCAAGTIDSSAFSFQPCYRYGNGRGFWKERNVLNKIEEKTKKRSFLKTYVRFVAIVPSFWIVDGFSLEGSSGYSEDPFLYGAFTQMWVKTPLYNLSVGVEVYSSQRKSLNLGWSSGSFSIK